jgi:hypothetical protein
MSSGRLIQMLERLPLYDGVLTARAQAEMDKTAPRQDPGQPQSRPGVTVVGSSQAEIATTPAFAGLFEMVKV